MARRHDPGVFDVSKPHKTQPSATSRPIIVGHHPQVSDPMVKEETKKNDDEAKTIPVSFHSEEKEAPHSMITQQPKMAGGSGAEEDEGQTEATKFDEEHDRNIMAHAQTKKTIEPVNPDIKPLEEP